MTRDVGFLTSVVAVFRVLSEEKVSTVYSTAGRRVPRFKKGALYVKFLNDWLRRPLETDWNES